MERWILLGGVVVVALFGLWLAFTAAVRWLRDDPRHSLAKTYIYGVAGLLFLAVSGVVAYQFRAMLFTFLRADYTASPAQRDELKKADLEAGLRDRLSVTDQWPQWRGPHRDGISSETGLNWNWNEKTPAIPWRTKIGGGYASIAVAEQRLYTMDKQREQERILCLDAEKGNVLWEHAYDVNGYDAMQGYEEGPRATPTVHEGRIYTVGGTGIFTCVELPKTDADKPKRLWQIDLMKEFEVSPPRGWWGYACSPLIVGDLVIVTPGGNKGSVAAFDRIDGKLKWWSARQGAAFYSSPVHATLAGTPQVVCFTGYGVLGLDPRDGRELWYFEWATEYYCNAATPVIVGDFVFISSDYNAGCALFKVAAKPGGGLSTEKFYVKPNQLMRNHFDTCVFHKDCVFGSDSLSFSRWALTCLDLKTFEVKWSHEMQRTTGILAEGHLVLLDQTGTLHCVAADPAEFRTLGELKVLSGTRCWAPPALAAGRLYLRDHKELVCIDLRK